MLGVPGKHPFKELHTTLHPPVNALSEVNAIDMTPVDDVTVPGRLAPLVPVNGPAI